MTLISVEGAVTPVRASAGSISFDARPCVALLVMAHDEVEALKVSATDLRRSERRFQTALGNPPVSMFEQDSDLRYT